MEDSIYLEPSIDIRIRRANYERPSRPKYAFEVGDEQIGDLSVTRRCLHVVQSRIENDGCECIQLSSQSCEDLWEIIALLARDRYWTDPPRRISRIFNQPFSILECDFDLTFETLGLVMLSIIPGTSFLHIHSGTGYACTIAACLVGPQGVNHGVEFSSEQLAQAKQNSERLLRVQPRMQEDSRMPVYHAHFPVDILTGKAKFDYILVNDCFRSVEDALILKDLLTEEGVAVSAFSGYIDGVAYTGMIMIMTVEYPIEEQRGDIDGHKTGQFYQIHPVEGILSQIINFIFLASNKTIEELSAGRDNPVDQSDENVIPSLWKLALQACCRRSDPINRLRGQSSILMRAPVQQKFKPVYSHLTHVVAAFHSFRVECLVMDASDVIEQQAAVGEITSLVAAIESLGKRFVGDSSFYSWKDGERLTLPVEQGMMIWLLENISYFMRSFDIQSFKGVLFDSRLIDDACSVSVKKSLLNGFLDFFREVPARDYRQQAPWHYQLCFGMRMRRTITRLAARFFADATCLVRIVRAMKTLYEVKYERKLEADSNLTFCLMSCDGFLTIVNNEFSNNLDSLNSLQNLLSKFQPLTMRLRCLCVFAKMIMRNAPDIADVQTLFILYTLIFTTFVRNMMATGESDWLADHTEQFFCAEVENAIDYSLLLKEQSFLAAGSLTKESSVDETCAYLVRRFISDMKEVLWIGEGHEKEKRLSMLEESKRLYYLTVLEPLLPIPYIVTSLQAMD